MYARGTVPPTQDLPNVTLAGRAEGAPQLPRAISRQPAAVRALQRRAGNRAVATLLARSPVHPAPARPARRAARRMLQRECGGRPVPPCPTGYVSTPSNASIGSALGQWLGLVYGRDVGIKSYMLVDHWVYGRAGRFQGTLGQALMTRDPLVYGALLSQPDWNRYRDRIDILDSDSDKVYEVKPARGAGAGPAQLQGYLTALQQFATVAPADQGGRPRNWQPGDWEPDDEDYLLPISASLDETCFVCIWKDRAPQNAGVLIYDLLCCHHDPPTVPVPVPREVVERLLKGVKDLLDRLGKAVDDLGPWGKVVGAIALVLLAAAAIYFELPAAILAAIARFFGIMLPALFDWLGAGVVRAAVAVTAMIAGTAGAQAATSGKTDLSKAPQAPADPPKTTQGPADAAKTPRPAPAAPAVTPVTPAAIPGLLKEGLDMLHQIEKSGGEDPLAAEIRKLATTLRKRAEGYRAPGKPASTASAPGGGEGRWVPRDEDFCLAEPVAHGDTVDAYVWAHYPKEWGSRWGGMPATLKVVSHGQDWVVLEFVEDFLGPYGVPHGRRFKWTRAAQARCATEMPHGPG